jgi:hypothetical protein
MLQISQIGIEGPDVIDNDIHRWLPALLELRDVKHVMHTCQGLW